jgi:hypothetical protein
MIGMVCRPWKGEMDVEREKEQSKEGGWLRKEVRDDLASFPFLFSDSVDLERMIYVAIERIFHGVRPILL